MSNQQNHKKKLSQKEALGKGIRSLLQNMDSEISTKKIADKGKERVTAIEHIALNKIEINPAQPRQNFKEEALNQLADSIKLHGVIQPITVSKLPMGKFRLVSGERRWRASKIAGKEDIPAYIRQTNSDSLLELALLENLQREDLNAIEISLSLDRLMTECNLTQEELAVRISKNRSTVTNYLRLLKLPPDIQAAIRANKISMGHAKALIALPTIEKQLFAFKEIIRHKLSVRQTEALARKLSTATKNAPSPTRKRLTPQYKQMEDHLASYFSTKVKLNRNEKGVGSITVDFYSDEELNHILSLMM